MILFDQSIVIDDAIFIIMILFDQSMVIDDAIFINCYLMSS